MINSSLLTGVAKCLGALVLSVLVLWQTAENSGSAESEVVVHVAAGDVKILVDEAAFLIKTAWKDVIVCRLRPGRHSLRMMREGDVVYEETFTVEPGRDVVLTAWESSTD